jgi:hypothetical protein
MTVVTIALKKTILILGIYFALASLGLQRVAAQNAPAPNPTAQSAATTAAPQAAVRNTTRASHPAAPLSANAAQQDPDETKVARIYRGTGRFDLAMAQKLRPNLAKAFPPGKSPALQAAAIATGSSAPNPEISKKITKSNDL